MFHAPLQPTRLRRPWVIFIVMAFLGYAAFVALPVVVLAPPRTGQTLTAVQVALSFAAFLALWVSKRSRLTFELVRLTLALWAVRGLCAAWRIIAAPWFSGSVHPQAVVTQVLMALGVGALCVLFWAYSFGRTSREFYGM